MRLTRDHATAEQEILAWRSARLTGVDFSLPLAARLAGDGRFDPHALIELLERGCPPELAVRILAPLDEGATV